MTLLLASLQPARSTVEPRQLHRHKRPAITMRLSPFFLAGTAAAAAVSHSSTDCLLNNHREMAADAHCPDHQALSLCFANLPSSDPELLADCYIKAGCKLADAIHKAEKAQARCKELFPGDAELRRRRAGEPDLPQITQAPRYASADLADLWARSAATGDDCLTTFSKSTKTCPVSTVDGSVASGECSTVEIDTSSCLPGKTCSMDSNGNDICMDLKDDLDVAGIVVSIVFGVFIVLGIATLTWLCCKDRKEQKRMAAKAEATALARAATKKKKAAEAREQRAPLMREERKRDASQGSTDPFHDRNRS